jgi:hypothetical protein
VDTSPPTRVSSPCITQFAYTTHRNAEGRQQFVVCRGLGLFSEVDDIYRSVPNSFDVLSRTWKVYPSKGSSPKTDADAAVVYFDNSLYCFGGVKAKDSIDPSLADDKLYHYDLTMRTWQVLSVSNPPPSRNLFGMAVYQETLYVFQGWSSLLSNQLTQFSSSSSKLRSSPGNWSSTQTLKKTKTCLTTATALTSRGHGPTSAVAGTSRISKTTS